MFKFLTNLFDSNEKQLNQVQPIVDKINDLEDEYVKLTDEQLRNKTEEFRKILNVDLKKSREQFKELNKVELAKVLDDEKLKMYEILPDAFATVREASKRVANHRHFDVQMLAAYVLFDNKVAELFTGEGKTLAANMPLYLYALSGRGAHLVTVNDYLAKRDAEWNGHILGSLGITVAAIGAGAQYRYVSDEEAIKLKGDEAKEMIAKRDELEKKAGRLKYDHMSGVNLIECSKKEAYDCDIVYGTNNEYGFDYLRDNMVRDIDDRVQGPRYFAIVDEADSILIDEARTPLIISTSAQASNDMYSQFSTLVKQLSPEKHYVVDEKANAVSLTDEGMDQVEKLLKVDNVYENAQFAYHLDNALKAKELYKKDDEYMIKNGEVIIVDEFTGRAMEGRRYSEGLHQAIEAKEGVEVKRESRTMATITLQNYFRLYSYLSSMTATALTEAEEFSSIYHLDTIVVPTNNPVIREDHKDVVYKTEEAKFNAIVEDIKVHFEKKQPILVGTTSVEKSEFLSELLSKQGVPHEVLNAKYHEREAKIVSQAGQKGSVTIATNMAGRGTDIALEEGVTDLGGLYVIGSERHESRRIDNQLRGRSGRQGDPGETRFYISFEDDLMRLFGGERMQLLMSQVGLGDDVPISMGILGTTIENAQKKVEAQNYDIRKRLVEYDDVLNQQRDIIYGLRTNILKIAKKERNGQEFNSKADLELAKEMDIEKVQDQLDAFTLSQESSWHIEILSDFTYGYTPLEIWILKEQLAYMDFLFAAQRSDDMKIDEDEESKVITQIKNLLSEEVYEKALKKLKYTDEELTDLTKVKKLILMAFVIHSQDITQEALKELSKVLILESFDRYWMEHLDNMADLREGISLRNLAQRDPLVEYKNEGFEMFDKMFGSINQSVRDRFFKVRIVRRDAAIPPSNMQARQPRLPQKDNRPGQVSKQKTIEKGIKVGRNDPCPCGSGKKYKKCCYPKYE
ncbi:MAG: SEC-C metal-binding domain-containing protein [Candidatus Dojkabacteria bacterium]|jgi:preprotein translocase subunit SecA|nr:SEC-C domain-containing protein [Candidatus Dojkabacteria bacterium]MDD2270370.1 SEC-C metal-binding domain-containing protein [Candidatus Dojkabacteria bacterium]